MIMIDTHKGNEFLNKLADLFKEYDVEMFYTTDDDGIHVEVAGEPVFTGYLDIGDVVKEILNARVK